MMSRSFKTEIPSGVRDLMPGEAWCKRELEREISDIFRAWGYQEVVTPAFEYFDVLKIGQRDEQLDLMYKFIDRQGRILALRPDMTTPIARLTASRQKRGPFPLRLFYIANVFSYEEPQAGRQREYYQAGVELIGSGSPEADAEVLALAVEVLKKIGLQNFKLSVGQIDIFNGLMEELEVAEEVKKEIKTTISNQNFVGVEEMLHNQKLPEKEIDKVMQIITLRGSRRELESIRPMLTSAKALKALDNLEEVFAVLTDYRLDRYVDLDLGLLRDFDYYTGLVFEGSALGLGFPICGGGRYDGLLGQFGLPCPATGFALGIERIMLALERQGHSRDFKNLDYIIEYETHRRLEAFDKAAQLRAEGHRVVTRDRRSGVQLNSEDSMFSDAKVITLD
ncbi:MAG: ATP phosphoribosyltransferase regulatory subunit [Thermincola ferriacetica]